VSAVHARRRRRRRRAAAETLERPRAARVQNTQQCRGSPPPLQPLCIIKFRTPPPGLQSGNLTGSYDAVFENTAEGIPSVRLFRQGSASEPQDYLGTIYLEPGLATTFPSPAGPANAPWALQKVC
jgi:hypothetical protein